MTTVEYLNQLKNIDRRIADKRDEAEKWRVIAYGNRTVSTDRERVLKSIDPDKMGNAVIKAIEYEKEADTLAEWLIMLRHHIIEQIDGMEDISDSRYYNILKGYYLRDMSFAAIGYELGFSTKQVARDYKKALVIFESLYYDEYKELEILSSNVLICPNLSTVVH